MASRAARVGSDLALDDVLLQCRKQSAGLFGLLEQRPCGVAEFAGQRLDAAGAGGGIADLGEIGFFQQHKLGVARNAAREGIGQPQRQRVRQHGDRIRPAEARGEGRDRRAQHVHEGVALGQHSPGRLRIHEDRLCCETTGLFDARPEQSERSKLCQREKLIGIGTEPERQRGAGGVEFDPRGLQRAQIGKAGCQRERQFLGVRSPGVIDRPAIGKRKWPLEAAFDQAGDHLAEGTFELCPGGRRIAANRNGAERLIVEMDVDSGGIDFAGFNDIGEILAGVLPSEHGIESNHDTGVEIDTLAQASQRFPGCIGNAKAAGTRSARKFKFQPGSAILEVMQRLRIGLRRIRMIDPLHDLPGCCGRAAGNRARHPWRGCRSGRS